MVPELTTQGQESSSFAAGKMEAWKVGESHIADCLEVCYRIIVNEMNTTSVKYTCCNKT